MLDVALGDDGSADTTLRRPTRLTLHVLGDDTPCNTPGQRALYRKAGSGQRRGSGAVGVG